MASRDIEAWLESLPGIIALAAGHQNTSRICADKLFEHSPQFRPGSPGWTPSIDYLLYERVIYDLLVFERQVLIGAKDSRHVK